MASKDITITRTPNGKPFGFSEKRVTYIKGRGFYLMTQNIEDRDDGMIAYIYDGKQTYDLLLEAQRYSDKGMAKAQQLAFHACGIA